MSSLVSASKREEADAAQRLKASLRKRKQRAKDRAKLGLDMNPKMGRPQQRFVKYPRRPTRSKTKWDGDRNYWGFSDQVLSKWEIMGRPVSEEVV